MSYTRSGLQYRGEYSPMEGLVRTPSPDRVFTNDEVANVVQNDFIAISNTKGVDIKTGNIAAILAKFSGLEPVYAVSYSTQSKVSIEDQGELNLESVTTNFPGEVSLQTNSQARNHTEPKLLQGFTDRYLYEGSPLTALLRWVIVITDRNCCGSCMQFSIKPFAEACKQRKVEFYTIELNQTLGSNNWQCVRTRHA